MQLAKGRKERALDAEVLRPLGPEDQVELLEYKANKAPALTRIRARHHTLARCVAGGMQPTEAAAACGMTPQTVYNLLDDPTFKELLTAYKTDVNKVYLDFHQRLADLAIESVEVLHDRVENTPEEVTTGQLIELVKTTADRTGHGPQTSNTNVNINVGMADRLKAARERVKVIDTTYTLVEEDDENA